MKLIAPSFQDHLDAGVTTLAWCWRLTRRDGVRFGFTDHDRDISFDETTFEAAAGFTASEIRDSVGLSVDNLDVSSALTSDRLREADLAAGAYDDASVEIFRVNWQAPEQRVLMRSGSLGEVRRAGLSFSAEVRGLSHRLQQPRGRLFQYTCDADLGDSRCGVALAGPAFTGAGTIVAATSRRSFTVAGLSSYADAWFSRGVLTFTAGPATGLRREVREHRAGSSSVTIELWEPLGHLPEAGEAFTVTAGCDKHFTTCQGRFSNAANFRGFPHMPGNDFVTGYVRRG